MKPSEFRKALKDTPRNFPVWINIDGQTCRLIHSWMRAEPVTARHLARMFEKARKAVVLRAVTNLRSGRVRLSDPRTENMPKEVQEFVVTGIARVAQHVELKGRLSEGRTPAKCPSPATNETETQRTYKFTIKTTGMGRTPEEAWQDATETIFGRLAEFLDPDDVPDYEIDED